MATIEFVSVPVPVERVQEVYQLLGQAAKASSTRPAYDEELQLVERVTKESPPTIRRVLGLLASRPDEAIRFAAIAEELGVHPYMLRADMAQFTARWNDVYGQRGKRWFFEARGDHEGKMVYRMNARVAEVVRSALQSVSGE
jgi:hypothetical protein